MKKAFRFEPRSGRAQLLFCAAALALAISRSAILSPAQAQVCPSPAVVNNTACTVTPGTTINVTTAGATGLNASGGGGQITGDGITVNLGAATTTGALAQQGAAITVNNSIVSTTSIGAAANGQIGLRATGAGSTIDATGATIDLTPASGTSNNMAGVIVDNAGAITLSGTTVTMTGGGNGNSNHGLTATGTGSQISFSGGSVSTASRGTFGALAQAGGIITLNAGTQITTTGADIVASATGSHGLIATGSGSQVNATGIGITTSGRLANGARAENGGAVSLTGATITSSSPGVADLDPSSAVRALSGGQITLDSSSITTTGIRGNGLSVEGPGSHAVVSDTNFTVTGQRVSGIFIFNGGTASVTGGISQAVTTAVSGTAVLVQDAGSSIDLTNTILNSTGPVGFGLRVNTGGAATMIGGSSTTQGRDSPGLTAGNGTLIASNVTVNTSGDDNAMGALADLNGHITLNGGSLTTSGDSVRLLSFPAAIYARNPGGTVISTGTTLLTQGVVAAGAVADDGGTVLLNGNSVTTMGDGAFGLFAVAEQVGAQFPANLTATDITLQTFGLNAHGAVAQARSDLPVDKATLTINNSAITTHGNGAVGLRAVLSDYGAPIQGRGEAALIANGSTVLTEGIAAHGALSFDSPTSVIMNDTTVLTTGAIAHGSVAEAGGVIVGSNAAVTATGANAAALFLTSEGAPVSTAVFSNRSTLTNVSGPTIDVAGAGNVTLTATTAGGSGQWLRVGTIDDFPRLALPEPPLRGIQDPDVPPLATPPLPAAPVVVPGLANVTLSDSTVTGSAFTAPGSVSNLTLRDNSIWNLTGNSNITNLINDPSLILFSPPAGAGFKTLTVVNYIGEGGIIGLHTFLGTDGSPSDKLVIDAGTASGLSGLRITNAGGPGAVTAGNGILVVDAVNGGTTEPTAFSLARPAVAGPYEYTLHRSSVDTSNPEAWYLRSTIDCSLPDAPVPPCPGPGPGPNPPPVPPVPNIRPEVSLYTALPAMALFYGRTLLDTLHERVGEQEQLRAFANPGANPYANGAWGRIIAQHAERDSNSQGIFGTAGPQYDVDFTALQAGLDVYRRQQEDGSRNHAGLYGAFGRGDGDVTHLARIGAGTDTFDAWSVGGYWTWYAPMGAYIDTVLQGTWYDMTADPRRLPASDTDGFAVAASVEGGYPLQLGGGWVAEPQAQAIWQSLDLDETRDIGATIRFEDETSLAARIGLRLAKSWTAFAESGQPAFITAWFRPNLWYEFEGEPKTLFSSATGFIPFRADIGGSWLELNAGVSARVDAMVSLYANAGYDIGLSADGDAYNGKVGIRVNW